MVKTIDELESTSMADESGDGSGSNSDIKRTVNDDGDEEESSEDEEGQDTPLDDAAIKAALVPEGMEAEIKQLYLGKQGVEGSEPEWVDRMPMAMSMKASAMTAKERERAKYSILVRMELRPRARFTEDNPVQIHSLVVQSPLLRKVLLRVFAGHPGLNAAEPKLTFNKPLAPFVHRWKQLQQAVEGEKDAETKKHLDLMMESIKKLELTGTISARDLCISRDAITFEDLWMIFEPGELVVTVKDKTDCAFKLTRSAIRKNKQGCWFVLECVCTDFDGEIYGKANELVIIPIFWGSEKITELPVIPLALHPNKAKLTEMFLDRSAKFQSLAGVKNMLYQGTAIDKSDPNDPKKLYVNGRIVVDADSYIRFNPGELVEISPFKASKTTMNAPNIWDKRYAANRSSFSHFGKKEISELPKLTEEQQITCRHLVRGYSLKLKIWLEFQIEGIRPIIWNDYAFDRLILPGDHKNLLLAFAKGQRDSDEGFDDIIEGKGKGMIIQLHGPPGVGKTLTAEAVAETMRVPLYTISAGDLGLEPEQVQHRLSNAFQLARTWSAVLLLDEADVFMEKRDINDMQRNQLVSLFLQSLEYYEGTLFLTTNRVETFDPAFESRVHIAITYENLTLESRKEVWNTFLGIRSNPGDEVSAISEKDIDEFVKVDMNGREIKNVVKSASLLALSEKGKLRPDHIRTVLRIKLANKRP